MREDAPVRWNARWRGWVVTGHDDARLVLRDPTSYSSERVANHQRAAADGDEADDAFTRFPAMALIGKWVSFLDPPDHTPLRRPLSGAFTVRATRPPQPFTPSPPHTPPAGPPTPPPLH